MYPSFCVNTNQVLNFSQQKCRDINFTGMSQKQPPITLQPTGKVVQRISESNNVETSLMMYNVPPGLECLANLRQIVVKQKIEVLEAIMGCETTNKYEIFDNAGNQIFYGQEETDCCNRNCCGRNRPFNMTIQDRRNADVIHLSRPLACDSCCFPCCLQSIDIQAPPGNIVGRVEQEWSILIPRFRVKDAAGNIVLRIEGPCCTMSCCGSDVDFQVLSADGAVEVGKISKKWSGLAKELFTDADNFGISFPMDLDIKMKAVMIGACMLIDFMFFEITNRNLF